ncbi:hypothetical protein N7532_003097 [Penicillium argentinense]|uniref:Uncharacterized protein n=1 Tax=Penicillium argentinense TaxID=1131581 RepID=A0A9W9KEA7_9EURO|nr:uncharacterized protein N7532_003097 [Penicillium argentinense]KAJ5102568.1 hypothetical protein N7532_003097 [Penicillium argentinense]
MRASLPLTGGHCDGTAAKLSPADREKLGLTETLRHTLDDSFAALVADRDIEDIMGPFIASSYLTIKKGEADTLHAMDNEKRKLYLISKI